jgi:hypothetical protein
MENFESSQENKKDFFGKMVTHPLFLTLVGPIFLMLNLAGLAAFFSLPSLLFSCAAALGYGFSWKYHIKGALYSFGLLGFSCAFLFLIESLPFSFGITLLFFISFSSAYFLVGLAADTYAALKQESENKVHQTLISAENTYQTNLKYLENQLEDQIEHGKSLDKALKIQDKELLSLRQLIKMSHLEADKYKQESLAHKQLVETYHQQLVFYEQQEEKTLLLQQRAKDLVKNLNEVRVNAYQQRMMLENYEQHLQASHKISFVNCENSSEELEHLKLEKSRIKSCYYEQLRKYQAIFAQIESWSSQEGQTTQGQNPTKDLLCDLENQAKLLQDLRLDILKVEETIVHLRKELKMSSEDGLSSGNYLAIADQECMRLEEENALLLKLVATLCTKPHEQEELNQRLQEEETV